MPFGEGFSRPLLAAETGAWISPGARPRFIGRSPAAIRKPDGSHNPDLKNFFLGVDNS
jgi:hypothetical protein